MIKFAFLVLLIEYTNQRLCKQRKIRKSGISARYFRNNKVKQKLYRIMKWDAYCGILWETTILLAFPYL